MTGRALSFGQELLNAFHPLFVFDFRERILNRTDGIEIRKVQRDSLTAAFVGIDDMLFNGAPVIDDFLFFRC